MKIKIFQGMSEKKVESSVNEFLAKKDIKVLEIKFKPTASFFAILIIYEETDKTE